MINTLLSHSHSQSTTNNTLLNENNKNLDQDLSEVEDKRRINFAMIDYLFIDSGFDAYTQAFYLKIVRRGDNEQNGFFESRKNTAKQKNISIDKIRECRDLLAFCNIIKIYTRKNMEDSGEVTPKIELIDKKFWKLDHEYRDAGKFYKATKEKKIAKKPNGIQYVEFYEDNGKRKLRVLKTIEANVVQTPLRHWRNPPYATGVTPLTPVAQHNKNPDIIKFQNNVCEEKTHTHTSHKKEDKKKDAKISVNKNAEVESTPLRNDLKTVLKEKEKSTIQTQHIRDLKALGVNLSIEMAKSHKSFLPTSKFFAPNSECERILTEVKNRTSCKDQHLIDIIQQLSDRPWDCFFKSTDFKSNQIIKDMIRMFNDSQSLIKEYDEKIETQRIEKEEEKRRKEEENSKKNQDSELNVSKEDKIKLIEQLKQEYGSFLTNK
jgi:hypothetical protein